MIVVTEGKREQLAPAAEAALVERAQHGDPAAVTLLVEAHLPLVVRTARWYEGHGVEREDLLAEAWVGFLEGLSRYIPGRGVKLMSYVIWWVRWALARALQAQGRNVRLPRAAWRQRSAAWGPLVELSLSDRVGGDGSQVLGDTLVSGAPDPHVLAEREEREHLVGLALQRLADRDRQLLSRRLGVGGSVPETRSEAGARLGVSRERIRQVETRAVARLRRLLATPRR